MKVRVEVTRKLDIYDPTMDVGDALGGSRSDQKWGVNRYINQNFNEQFFYHYPYIIDPDGSLWIEANRFILSRIKGVNIAKYRTLESLSSDLTVFRKWSLESDIDYLNIPKRQRARPTYRYCYYLHGEVKKGNIKASTAKRRMSTVQNLYRWMALDGVDFQYPLWIESDVFLYFKNKHGFQNSKTVKSTDLTRSFKEIKSSKDYSEYIDDGGRLRPLPKDEQVAVVESLCRIQNIEMFLGFMVSLAAGARLQTTFTFRVENFSKVRTTRNGYCRLKVGLGTQIDTKYGKQMVLHIPDWLYDRIHIYLQSERYLSRAQKSPHVYEDEGKQYVFLTRAGRPYYMADNDPFTSLYRSPPRGNAITQFIRQQLKPDLLAHGFDFDFIYHFLRATFGMNLVESKMDGLSLGDSNTPEFFNVLMYVRERMGHSQLSTTELYLNYRQKFHLAMHVQDEYEKYLETITDKFGDSYDLG